MILQYLDYTKILEQFEFENTFRVEIFLLKSKWRLIKSKKRLV